MLTSFQKKSLQFSAINILFGVYWTWYILLDFAKEILMCKYDTF